MVVFRRDPEQRRASVEAGIRLALADAESMLRIAHARLELVSFEPETGEALLTAEGGCEDCDFSVATLASGLEAHLRQRVPDVRAVRLLPT